MIGKENEQILRRMNHCDGEKMNVITEGSN